MKKIKKTAAVVIAGLLLVVAFTNFNQIKIKYIITEKSVTIGKQQWMSENLNVSVFKNGSPIQEVKSDAEWNTAANNKTAAWCYYNYDSKNGEKYGKLYNWFAVSSTKGLAPKGWRIPKEKEWKTLIDFLGKGESAKKLKSKSGWTLSEGLEKYGNGTDEYGFTALPGGHALPGGSGFGMGSGFVGLGQYGNWWCADGYKEFGNGIMFEMVNYSNEVKQGNLQMRRGCSVRCIK